AQIESDQAEAARLQKQIRSAERLVDFTASHPEQMFQLHAGGFRRVRIKGVELGRARGQGGKKNAGTARTRGATNVREAAARQSSHEGVDCGNAGRNGFD